MKLTSTRILLMFAGFLSCMIILSFAEEFAHEEVPFQAGVKSSKAEVRFNVPTTARHSFYLNLYFKAGDPRDPERRKDRDRVQKLAGSGAYDPKTKRRANNGLPIPVRITIARLRANSSEGIFDEVYMDHELEGFTSDYYSKLIVRYKLDAGQYLARIEALDDVPLLQTVPIRFDVHVAYDRS